MTANWYAVETKDFNLSLGFNISFNRNTVDKLDGSDSMIATSGWGVSIGSDDYRAIVGKSIGRSMVTNKMVSILSMTLLLTKKRNVDHQTGCSRL